MVLAKTAKAHEDASDFGYFETIFKFINQSERKLAQTTLIQGTQGVLVLIREQFKIKLQTAGCKYYCLQICQAQPEIAEFNAEAISDDGKQCCGVPG